MSEPRLVSARDFEDASLFLLWPALSNRNFKQDEYRRFLDHFAERTAELARQHSLSNEDVKKAISALTGTPALTRSTFEDFLAQSCGGVASGRGTAVIELMEGLGRLCTMMAVQVASPQYALSELDWSGDDTIASVVQRYFDRRSAVPHEPPKRIHGAMTAAALVAYHDVTISWTSNLSEHLTMDWTGRVLRIFEHKIWVLNHLKYPDRSPVPQDVLGELMSTLNLLFPQLDAPTKSLLERHGMMQSFYDLGYCGQARWYDGAKYKYWHREIQDLNDLLDEPPRGLQQFWRPDPERRNLLNLALFWISGVVVLILTIVSSVCGVLSVQYSKEQVRLAAVQLDLSLAQACAAPDAPTQLPQFCSLRTG